MRNRLVTLMVLGFALLALGHSLNVRPYRGHVAADDGGSDGDGDDGDDGDAD